MTENERRLWVAKCGQILHLILVDIRGLSHDAANVGRIEELADLGHNLPLFMTGQDDSVPTWLRSALIEYARKYHPDVDPAKSRYVFILDMAEAEFNEVFRRTYWSEPVGLAG
jgi:hypothetical protein